MRLCSWCGDGLFAAIQHEFVEDPAGRKLHRDCAIEANVVVERERITGPERCESCISFTPSSGPVWQFLSGGCSNEDSPIPDKTAVGREFRCKHWEKKEES